MADHRVVVFGIPDDPEQLRDLIAELAEVDRVTAGQLVRNLPGVLPQILTRNAAAGLATEIRRLGLTATSIPMADAPDLSHARSTHHVRLSEQGFEVADAEDGAKSWPWSSVSLLSVGIVPSTAPPHSHPAPTLASGSSHRLWNEGIRVPARARPEALVVLNEDEHVYRIASDAMNYEYLAQRLSTSSSINFRQLVGDLVNYATDAWVTPSTHAFLDRSPMSHYEFRSRDDFRRYTEFQTLRSRKFGHR